MTALPRLLLVARTRYELPLPRGLERKFAALRERFDLRVLATSASGRPRDDGTFRLVGRLPVLDGPLFYLLLPLRVRRIAGEHRPAAIVTQSPYEAACVWLGYWRRGLTAPNAEIRRAFAEGLAVGLRQAKKQVPK